MRVWRNSNKAKEDKNEIGLLENRTKQMRGVVRLVILFAEKYELLSMFGSPKSVL